MSISLYEASAGAFVPYLGNLSALLDHGSAYARARNIESAVLLGRRGALALAAVLAHQIGDRVASAHFAFQLLEAQP